MRRCLTILILFGVIFTAYSQEKDFGTWYSAKLSGELFNLVDFSVEPEIRTFENSSRISSVLGELDLSVPVTKYLRFGGLYRAEYAPAFIETEQRVNRFAVYGEVDTKIDKFKITYRGIVAKEYANYKTSESGSIGDVQHRHKLSVKYARKKWDISPFMSSEVFFTLAPEWKKERIKTRTSLGFKYKVNKKIDLSLSYKIDQEYNRSNPGTMHILSIGFAYEL